MTETRMGTKTRQLMARKPPPDPRAPHRDPHGRQVIIQLKGTPAYAEWLTRLHQQTHIPRATMFRLAMRAWARAQGYPEPPEL